MTRLLFSFFACTCFLFSIAQKPFVQKKLNAKINFPYEDTVIKRVVINEWYCPQMVISGDREFDGNGPRIKCEVKIRISNDSSSLIAELYIWAQETKQDWSTTEGRWERKIFDAPYGKKIVKIVTESASRTQFITRKHGYQKEVAGETFEQTSRRLFDGALISDQVLKMHNVLNRESRGVTALYNIIYQEQDKIYTKGFQYMKVPAMEGTLVRYFSIVGDTDGSDISDDRNCDDDTRIVSIDFFPIKIELRRR
jgi:hypothetical protein